MMNDIKRVLPSCLLLTLLIYTVIMPHVQSEVVPNIPHTTIITSGYTNTIGNVPGKNIYQVDTKATAGKFALNSFSKFDIGSNDVYNFILPQQSEILINRVLDNVTSHINGVLNLRKSVDGPIGGTLIHLSPGGIQIGPGAMVNVGSGIFAASNKTLIETPGGESFDLNQVTPSEFMEGLKNVSLDANIHFTVSPSGEIVNLGSISANRISGNASGSSAEPYGVPQLIFVAENILNGGAIVYRDIEPASYNENGRTEVLEISNLGKTLDQGGGVMLIGTGGLDMNIKQGIVQPTTPASSDKPTNGNVINAGRIRTANSDVYLISNANRLLGNENKVVTDYSINTTALDSFDGGGNIFMHAIGTPDHQSGPVYVGGVNVTNNGKVHILTDTSHYTGYPYKILPNQVDLSSKAYKEDGTLDIEKVSLAFAEQGLFDVMRAKQVLAHSGYAYYGTITKNSPIGVLVGNVNGMHARGTMHNYSDAYRNQLESGQYLNINGIMSQKADYQSLLKVTYGEQSPSTIVVDTNNFAEQSYSAEQFYQDYYINGALVNNVSRSDLAKQVAKTGFFSLERAEELLNFAYNEDLSNNDLNSIVNLLHNFEERLRAPNFMSNITVDNITELSQQTMQIDSVTLENAQEFLHDPVSPTNDLDQQIAQTDPVTLENIQELLQITNSNYIQTNDLNVENVLNVSENPDSSFDDHHSDETTDILVNTNALQ